MYVCMFGYSDRRIYAFILPQIENTEQERIHQQNANKLVDIRCLLFRK